MDKSENKDKISALIICFNEEDRIEDCLKSLTWADEIVVIDSFSNDNSVEIAKNYTDKVYQQSWLGFSKQRNYGIDKCSFEWILTVDADERISPELKEEIYAREKGYDGYYLPRKTFFLGRWIKHCGWYPDYVLRLCRKGKFSYDEANLVHESIKLQGKAAYLKKPLIHYPYRNLEHYLSKLNSYTSLAAKELQGRGRKSRLTDVTLRPLFTFLKMYILRRGYLDGKHGFILSLASSFYNFFKYAKLWEENRQRAKEGRWSRCKIG